MLSRSSLLGPAATCLERQFCFAGRVLLLHPKAHTPCAFQLSTGPGTDMGNTSDGWDLLDLPKGEIQGTCVFWEKEPVSIELPAIQRSCQEAPFPCCISTKGPCKRQPMKGFSGAYGDVGCFWAQTWRTFCLVCLFGFDHCPIGQHKAGLIYISFLNHDGEELIPVRGGPIPRLPRQVLR